MKWSKYNNPNKKRKQGKRSPYSSDYIRQQREEMRRLLESAKDDHERECIRKAFEITIRP